MNRRVILGLYPLLTNANYEEGIPAGVLSGEIVAHAIDLFEAS